MRNLSVEYPVAMDPFFEHLYGDSEKVEISERLREETKITLDRIARRLEVGSKTYRVVHGAFALLPTTEPESKRTLPPSKVKNLLISSGRSRCFMF